MPSEFSRERGELDVQRAKTAIVLGLRYVFLTRFSWLCGLALLAIGPISLGVAPSLLANLFVLDHPYQLVEISWITMWAAATVMETMRVTTQNADDRFDDYREAAERFRDAWGIEDVEDSDTWYLRRDGWVTFFCGFVAALAVWYATVDACVSSTVGDPTTAWAAAAGSSEVSVIRGYAWRCGYQGLGIAIAAWMAMTAVAIIMHEYSNRRWMRGLEPPFLGAYRFLDHLLGPGYFRCEGVDDEAPEDAGDRRQLRLAPGHFSVLCYTIAFLIWYTINYASATGSQPMPTESSTYSALFYFMLSLTLAIYILPGIAFFLDRYRVPVLLTPLVLMMIFYNAFDTDHYYQLNPAPARETAFQPPTITEAIDRWWLPLDREGKRTLVVVDASGGGIQASAWTAQVLTGLHERYGDPFSRSVGMISSVSGGSVGTMFYLANRTEAIDYQQRRDLKPPTSALSEQAIRRIRFLSRASAMEASAWGVAYADSMRAIFPPLVNEEVDRGWAIERVWRQRMEQHIDPSMSDWRLSDLGRASVERQLPVPVFNATFVESGQRLMISPLLGPPAESNYGGLQWYQEFPDSHPYVATAARLSATFPYVAPAARADGEGPVAEHHVVDGAYVDNEGAVTSVDWISKMLDFYQQEGGLERRPFDRILLIRIQAFPQDHAEQDPPKAHVGWRAELAAPLEAMLQVRRASQTERGDLEIDLLTRATRARARSLQQRYEADVKQIEERIASLSREQDSIQRVLDGPSPPPGKELSDIVRQQLEVEDQIRRRRSLSSDLRRKANRLEQLTVEAVMVDFRSPNKTPIPMSWKLTESQKRNIDATWQSLVDGRHPGQPLQTLDRYFEPLAEVRPVRVGLSR